MTHVAEEGNRRKGDMTHAEIGQSVLGTYSKKYASTVGGTRRGHQLDITRFDVRYVGVYACRRKNEQVAPSSLDPRCRSLLQLDFLQTSSHGSKGTRRDLPRRRADQVQQVCALVGCLPSQRCNYWRSDGFQSIVIIMKCSVLRRRYRCFHADVPDKNERRMHGVTRT